MRELLEIVGSLAGSRQPLPARVLGRAAPAHRRGARARAEPEADRRRRAGLRARRLDPGAGDQPARRPAGRLRPDVRLHRPRPRRRAPRLRPDRRHVPRRDRRGRPVRRALPRTRCTRTRRRCSRRSRRSRARRRCAASASCSRARCRARSHRRAVAGSITRCRYATEICTVERPPLVDHGGGRFAACHHPLDAKGSWDMSEGTMTRDGNETWYRVVGDLELRPDAGRDLPRRPGRRARLHGADREPLALRPRLRALRPGRLREEHAPAGRAGRLLDGAAVQGRARRPDAPPRHRRPLRGRRPVVGRHARRWSTRSTIPTGCARSWSPIRPPASRSGSRRRTGCAPTCRRTCRRR